MNWLKWLTDLLKPPTELLPIGTMDIFGFTSILLDKLEEDDKAELYLADSQCKVFSKDEVVKFLGLDQTDSIAYVSEKMDCDDYARKLYGKGLPLMWTTVHALNWFIDDTGILWFVEPQTDQISQNMENWPNWDVRFFLTS